MTVYLNSGELYCEPSVFSFGSRAGELTFLTQDPRDREGFLDNATPVEDQARLTLEHLRAGLKTLGQELEQIVSLTVLVPDFRDARAVAEVISDTYGAGTYFPATTFLGVMTLEGQCRVCMDAVAVAETDRRVILTPGVPLASGSRCHGVRAGDLIFLSGVDAAGPDGQVSYPVSIRDQTLEVLSRLDTILQGEALSLRHLCRTFMFLSDSVHRPGYGEARRKRYQGVFEEAEFPPNSGIMMRDLGKDILLRSVAIAYSSEWEVVTSPKVRLSPGSFSQAFRVGQWLFIAGQDAIGLDRRVRAEGDLAAQTEESLQYMEDILVAAGGTLDDLVKTTVYLVAGQDRAVFASAFQRFFASHGRRSAMPQGLSFEVKELAPKVLVEVDGVALLQT